MRRHLIAIAACAGLVASGCFPSIEDGHFACVDDEGCPQGMYCHGDQRCYSWEPVQENNADLCSNTYDDDGDGAADCFDEGCLEGGFCDDRPADCEPVYQTGCPAGMACYLFVVGDEVQETRCMMPGSGVQGDPCDATAATEGDRCTTAHGCATVTDQGLCQEYCDEDARCMDGSYCQIGTLDVGTCTTPCDPSNPLGGCLDGFRCITKSRLAEYRYVTGGAYHFCYWEEFIREAVAEAGDPCANPAPSWADPEVICSDGNVCVPPPGGGTPICRRVCNDAFTSPCPTGEHCETFYGPVYEARPVSSYQGDVLGYCLPD